MKIVVIGGTGLIGSKVVEKLRQLGHQVIVGSPNTGINTITGEGLAEAMKGTDVVIDLANSPSFDDNAVMEFFRTAGKNLLASALNAGVKHHIAVSIVNADKITDSGYMRAKVVQENIIKESGVPYTIIRSTQFLEFLAGIANSGTQGSESHVSGAQFQPIAAEDVSVFVTQVALSAPINGYIEIAGPERSTMAEFVGRYLYYMNDPRKVVSDNNTRYFGALLSENALVPLGLAKMGGINFDKWMKGQGVKS
ncbi:SDR family oxidoreductase [Flavihumibacter solisilvae]|uniref:NmrA family transcriptional regulator n=1 Tax=Flavihumibacter solisilvae TaxID=1349421 RepID=A0A0C1ILD7_9BACT|nr:SDR family oxidoreductase [Flavihumibacter solisilvae]KIC95010.1 NmrA family transcriptional regulator [Flavihumibacter solisilvae]